jgi:hypothetical protein
MELNSLIFPKPKCTWKRSDLGNELILIPKTCDNLNDNASFAQNRLDSSKIMLPYMSRSVAQQDSTIFEVPYFKTKSSILGLNERSTIGHTNNMHKSMAANLHT